MRQCKFIKPLLLREPPDPTSFRPRDIQSLLDLGFRLNRLGSERIYDTLRFWTMSAADFLDEYFESEIVKAHFAGSSIIGTALGPRSPGTAYVLLHHYMGEIDDTVGAWGFARGGMGAVSASLAASLQASGGTIRTGAGDRQDPRPGRTRRRRRVARRSGDPRAAGALEHGRQADLSRIGRGRRNCPASSCNKCATSRSAVRRASSTSRSTGCPCFRRFLPTRPARAATCTSPTPSR